MRSDDVDVTAPRRTDEAGFFDDPREWGRCSLALCDGAAGVPESRPGDVCPHCGRELSSEGVPWSAVALTRWYLAGLMEVGAVGNVSGVDEFVVLHEVQLLVGRLIRERREGVEGGDEPLPFYLDT